jgi:hypothetical protein
MREKDKFTVLNPRQLTEESKKEEWHDFKIKKQVLRP